MTIHFFLGFSSKTRAELMGAGSNMPAAGACIEPALLVLGTTRPDSVAWARFVPRAYCLSFLRR